MFLLTVNRFLTVLCIFLHLSKSQAQILPEDADGIDGLDGPDGPDGTDGADGEYEEGGTSFTFLISGGYIAEDVLIKAKFMVSIRTRTPEKYFGDNHYCAGTIIRISTIVTAAHCVMSSFKVTFRTRDVMVVAGTPNRLKSESTTRQYPVTSIRVHPNYIRRNTNDVAVLRIKGRIPDDNDTIQRIKLPTAPIDYNATCFALGWGRLYKKGPLSAIPTGVNMKVLSPEVCTNKTIYYKSDCGMLCATGVGNVGNTCRGDDGGPFMCELEFRGITSWAIGCGDIDTPSIFTDVYYNLDWINGSISCIYFNWSYLCIVELILLLTLFLC